MIIRGTPSNKELYINFTIDKGKELHKSGIIPCYIDEEYMWFKKEDIEGGEQTNE